MPNSNGNSLTDPAPPKDWQRRTLRISRSPRLYLQRKSPLDRETQRRGGARFAPAVVKARVFGATSAANSLRYVSEAQQSQPDVGATVLWPAGEVIIAG